MKELDEDETQARERERERLFQYVELVEKAVTVACGAGELSGSETQLFREMLYLCKDYVQSSGYERVDAAPELEEKVAQVKKLNIGIVSIGPEEELTTGHLS